MTYKRYIHKKGKRHGPYYYKNVRDESGKVRSVYLGKVTSRGKKPLEATIVFLTVLLIIISALFFIQNRNIVLSRIAAEEAMVPFEVDQILIKVLVKTEEYIEKELRVMNVGDGEVPIEVYASGISDIVNVIDSSFTIKPGQTKIVRLNLSSFYAAEGIEQSPGVYIGKILVKSDSYEKEVPVIIEIESKNVLFDMNLNPVARDRSVLQGSSTTFEIRVFNLQSIDSFNVGMEFFVKDINGNTIISEKESVVVKSQASFFKTLKIPKNLKTGNYVFAAQASFGNSIGTASYLFDVGEIAEERKAAKFIEFCRNDPLCWALSIIVLLLMFTIGAYAYFFIGAFIYQKLFGIGTPKKSAEEIEAEKQIAKEKKERLKVKQLVEKEGRKGLIGECKKLIDEGYRTLDKDNLKDADNKYAKLMENYIKLPSDRKVEIFKDINSFYKSLLLKKQQLKKKEEKEKEEEKEIEKREEGERERELNLREERRKDRKKKVFGFFHSLGLVKTDKEKKEYSRQKQKEIRQRELEKKKREDERRGFEEEKIKRRQEELRQKELEKKGKEEKIIERGNLEEDEKGVEKEHDLEKSLKELGEIFEKGKGKKKHGLIHRLIRREKKVEHSEEAKAELKRKLAGKSRTFIKCHKLLTIADKVLQNNDILKAEKFYLKSRNMYIKLEYLEKKEIYAELTSFYNKLSKGRK